LSANDSFRVAMDNEAYHYNEFILYKNENNTEVAAIKLKDAS